MSYWSHGHLIVARIAYDDLQANAPAVLASVNAELAELTKS